VNQTWRAGLINNDRARPIRTGVRPKSELHPPIGGCMAADVSFSEVLRLDAELVRLGRGVAALRLGVGTLLEALSVNGGHHELGFSSFEAYARERCERSGRWAADTRAVARRLAELPEIRAALRAGAIGWSVAELLARHVTAETEVEWLERARNATVRELRGLLRDRDDTGAGPGEPAGGEGGEPERELEPTRTLTVTAGREDRWLFECARRLAERVGGPMPIDALLQSLLAEGCSTLFELMPQGPCGEACDLAALERRVGEESKAQAAWYAKLERWRGEAERRCEARTASLPGFALRNAEAAERELPATPEGLDRELCRLCSELAERDLVLGMVAERARAVEAWRRLGFASEGQYARERVGVSLSSLKSKRTLAARAARVPELAAALGSGRIGYEAAYLLSRVATSATAEAWIARAEERTVKHLREEVEAAELLIREGCGRDQPPPDDGTLEAVFELERRIASGESLDQVREAAVVVGSAESTGSQMSGDRRVARSERAFGRAAFRWAVTGDTHRFWRALERMFLRLRSRLGLASWSFLRFLCESFCRIWLPAIRQGHLTDAGGLPAYFDVYRRDAFRCTSPVCTRRDVTAHHLWFRSHGGGDEHDNLAALCVWCHLRGIHEGRIAAEPPASRIRWRIGRRGTLRVDGRVIRGNAREAPLAGARVPVQQVSARAARSLANRDGGKLPA
jgi:hypothetical protein